MSCVSDGIKNEITINARLIIPRYTMTDTYLKLAGRVTSRLDTDSLPETVLLGRLLTFLRTRSCTSSKHQKRTLTVETVEVV